MTLRDLIDREIEKIERHRRKLDEANAPEAVTREFGRALVSAKKAKTQKGEAAISLLAEAQLLHERAREGGFRWAKIMEKIGEALDS